MEQQPDWITERVYPRFSAQGRAKAQEPGRRKEP